MQHLEKSRSIFKFINMSQRRSFSFVNELYSATFIKELRIPKHFFVYLLFNRSIASNFVIDTSFIYIDHDNLGINPK